ncbi:hypothetical protein ACTXT7_000886 [Hymenolepis weldensis]
MFKSSINRVLCVLYTEILFFGSLICMGLVLITGSVVSVSNKYWNCTVLNIYYTDAWLCLAIGIVQVLLGTGLGLYVYLQPKCVKKVAKLYWTNHNEDSSKQKRDEKEAQEPQNSIIRGDGFGCRIEIDDEVRTSINLSVINQSTIREDNILSLFFQLPPQSPSISNPTEWSVEFWKLQYHFKVSPSYMNMPSLLLKGRDTKQKSKD